MDHISLNTLNRIWEKVHNKTYPYEDFKGDMEIYFNFQDFPEEVKNKIHYMAYEKGQGQGQGQGFGYSSIMHKYYDLVVLEKLSLNSLKV